MSVLNSNLLLENTIEYTIIFHQFGVEGDLATTISGAGRSSPGGQCSFWRVGGALEYSTLPWSVV